MKGGYDSFFKAASQAKSPGKTGAKSALNAKSPNRFKVNTKVDPKSDSEKDEMKLSEAELRKMFKMNPTPKNKKSRRKNDPAPVPWMGMAISFFALLLSGFYLVSPETFEELYDRIEVGMTTAAAADDTAEKNSQPKGEKQADSASPDTASTSAESKPVVQEDLSYISKLTERKKELDAREAQLGELEEELHRQRAEVEVQIKRLEEMRRQIASVLNERVQIDEEKVNKLVEVYSNMKPKQAAEIIATLNEDLAVEVMGRMKKQNAAAILNLLEPQKAQVLSEKYTGYKTR